MWARRTLLLLAMALPFLGCQSTNQRSIPETDGAVPHIDKVLVNKKDHKLLLMNADVIVKSYSVALARGGLGPKQRQGDHKTPEGIYVIDSRNQASRFHRALHISYPSEADKERARKLGLDPGGDIMIHGIQNGLGWLKTSQRLVDWIDGCIAVTDEEIEEIWRLVPTETPIEIRP
jgi:murein L,D-transpeptidase YafK